MSETEVLHGYMAFWRNKETEVRAPTSLKARDLAVAHFKPKKAHEVTVVPCERPDGSTVTHSTAAFD